MQTLLIAKQQIDDACDLFCRRRFISALTLAGSAEEILGALIREKRAKGHLTAKTALGERVSMIARLKGTDAQKKTEKDAEMDYNQFIIINPYFVRPYQR